jgi:ferredoxin-NADP reductase
MAVADAVSVLGPVAAPRPGAPIVRRSVGLGPNATLVDRQDLTSTIVRLRILPDDGVPPFEAGQYFAIGLQVDDRLVQRPYSTASAPGERGSLEFLVRLVPDGELTPSLWQLRPGDRVRLGPPKGLFTLQPGDRRRHLFLATGTGIAPLLSMIGSLAGLATDPAPALDRPQPPIVVHGVATLPELAYHDHLHGLAARAAIHYVPALSRPADPANGDWRGRTGRLDALIGTIAGDAALDPAATVAYLCGNPAMIEAVSPRLAALGLPAGAIRAEHYWTL